jgi:hypothetical protein
MMNRTRPASTASSRPFTRRQACSSGRGQPPMKTRPKSGLSSRPPAGSPRREWGGAERRQDRRAAAAGHHTLEAGPPSAADRQDPPTRGAGRLVGAAAHPSPEDLPIPEEAHLVAVVHRGEVALLWAELPAAAPIAAAAAAGAVGTAVLAGGIRPSLPPQAAAGHSLRDPPPSCRAPS